MKILYNLIFLTIWHYVVFLIVNKPGYKFFYKECVEFEPMFFKKRERFYEKVFKIKIWKDLIPQYTSKSGFSKKNMMSLKIDYIKEFIAETYRAEIDHVFCCFATPFIFFANSFTSSVIFSILVFIFNLPCVLIQRYNRFRLRRLMLNINKSNRGTGYSLLENLN